MNFYDAVYDIARQKGISIERIGYELGHTARYVGSAKSRGSLPKVDNAAKIVNVCGHSLCIVPSDNVPEDAIIID